MRQHEADVRSSSGWRVGLGVAGGVAAYKAAEVLRNLQNAGCDVRVAMTVHATHFIAPLTFRALSNHSVIVDDYAPDNPDPIAHITFSQTIDLLLIAPATANIIAKFANGIADDFLSSTYLASTAPVLIAPAMNTTMWTHPATLRNIAQLRRDGVHIVEPDAGLMACGTTGPGRLSDPAHIVRVALELLQKSAPHSRRRDLVGERLLITAGATRERIDPVRYISNRSSGRMGFALAEAAVARGAEAVVVAGATTASVPQGINLRQVESAAEMHTAVLDEISRATIFVGAAAVADYAPRVSSASKIKKSGLPLTLVLEPTVDIIREVAAHRRTEGHTGGGHAGLLVIGFAAETEDVVRYAKEKLQSKKLDLIVANDVTADDAGFDVDTNRIVILSHLQSQPIEVPLMSKLDVAHRILDEVKRLRPQATSATDSPKQPL